MVILLVLAHPHEGSFNHAISDRIAEIAIQKGHKVIFHDLYKEKFDSILNYNEILQKEVVNNEINCYCEELVLADSIVIVHPNWWGQPPAILKGWVDRVFRSGVAYKFEEGDEGEGLPIGLLIGKTGLVFNTSNTFVERELEIFGDPLELIWRKCIFEFCGIDAFHRRMFETIVTSTPDQRIKWLDEVSEIVTKSLNL